MSKGDRAKIEQNANRVIKSLDQMTEQYNQAGVSEAALATTTGLAAEELAFALDYLENREAVVRDPMKLSSPPQFVIKPGRAWPEFRKAAVGEAGAQKSA